MTKRNDLSKEVENLSEEEIEAIDLSTKKIQGRSTGFEHSHAKTKYKANHFRSLNGNVDGLTKRDPGRAYKLISFNDFRANGFRDNRGWIPLTAKNKSVEDFPSPIDEYGINLQLDGFWHIGDRIWAFKPIEAYAEDRKMLFARNKMRASGVTQEFKTQSKKLSSDGREDMTTDVEDTSKLI